MGKKKASKPKPGPLTIERVPIDSVVPDPDNARLHSDSQLDDLKASLNRFGQLPTIFVSAENIIIKGNGTWEAAKRAGFTEVDVIRVPFKGAEARAYAIADNRLGETSEWDLDRLNAQLKELFTLDWHMPELGWDQAALESVLGWEFPSDEPVEPPEAEIDRAEELLAKWQVERGQIWDIGQHRLCCGDSTNPEDVGGLMQGEKALLMNTDPPYGVAYSDAARVAADLLHARQQREQKWEAGIENDELDGEELQDFLESAIRCAVPHLIDNAAFYLWHPMLTQGTFFAAAAAADILIHRQIIWVKTNMLFGFGDYHWQHELCFYGWRRGHRPKFYGERNQTTIWDLRHDTPGGQRNHPTQKPVELFTRPILNHTKEGELIYEPFAGSGSQFAAAVQTKRRCFGLEWEPKYCAVILERLSAMGLEPKLQQKTPA